MLESIALNRATADALSGLKLVRQKLKKFLKNLKKCVDFYIPALYNTNCPAWAGF